MNVANGAGLEPAEFPASSLSDLGAASLRGNHLAETTWRPFRGRPVSLFRWGGFGPKKGGRYPGHRSLTAPCGLF